MTRGWLVNAATRAGLQVDWLVTTPKRARARVAANACVPCCDLRRSVIDA
jgi:hypothetical protein